MIPETIYKKVLRRLRAAQREHSVRVLLAVESGSRAWGFASPDSDYDVRFIYAHPEEWYLSVGLEEQRDVIEYDIVDEIDLSGWDLRKALRLFWRSNPAFVEWIRSPIVYLESGSFAETARALLPVVYSCEKGIHHYRNVARANVRRYLRADLVPLKRYFYILRPLLAVRWLERYEAAAPIAIDELLHVVADDAELVADIETVLRLKRDTPERRSARPLPRIDAFIGDELQRLERLSLAPVERGTVLPQLDRLFRDCLREGVAGPPVDSSL